jgi:DnaJ-class molecular chaperone
MPTQRLAMRWHPDKNPTNLEGAQAKFREVSVAYDVPNDPEVRQIYDEFGEDTKNHAAVRQKVVPRLKQAARMIHNI